jgi:ubiquinone/menaquinone biosynthesis C-methylase UbiE
MLKRLLKIVLCIIALILVLGPAVGYWLRRSLNSSDLRTRYNLIYRFHIPSFKKEPNALLVETASSQTPGNALDMAMGEGRNAIWLATKKWDVTGFDISDEGLRQANANAQKAGVTINTVLSSSESFDYGHEKWDLIVMSYAFTPIEDEAYVARLRDSLKPGGLLVFEHYQKISTNDKTPGTIKPGQARQIFHDFKVLRCEEAVMRGDWLTQSRQPLIRLVATR